MEWLGVAVALVFWLAAWSAARDNRLADQRYWARDAERNSILDPVRPTPTIVDPRIWYTTSAILWPGPGTDFGYTHAIHRAWLGDR